uniref:DUF1935 domain-containing protein n=1 Tax=Trypanosoma congolense (strain IL3000) TaxID=1068625 RepID=G0UVP8_TRYCI|nr:conserved hypothetical protein [Trypanosoma congolense IL3000]
MTDLVPPEEVEFKNGTPSFPYERIYRCFSSDADGLLYRLEDNNHRWAFYNDTLSTVFNIFAHFNSDSPVTALSETVLQQRKGEWDYWATITMLPGQTALFIEGVISDFVLCFSSEGELCEDIQFTNGEPSMQYDRIYRCFKRSNCGMLFRLITVEKGSGQCAWSYHNDTRDFNVEVEVFLTDRESAQPLGPTQVVPHPTDECAVVYKTVVPPLRTVLFLRGCPRFSKQLYVAKALCDDSLEDASEVTFKNGSPDPRIIDFLKTRIFRGFSSTGNGIIFLLVDPVAKRWAFYNDSTDYVVTATVQFAPGSVYSVAGNTKVSEDLQCEGGTVCKVTVQPLATELFITDGNPTKYNFSLSAQCSSGPVAEKNPSYENGKPDTSVMRRWDTVFRCFQGRGNGMLFRLVDEKKGLWGFYNDTTDVLFTAYVSFDDQETVEPLGSTQIEEHPDLGTVLRLDIQPQATELFVVGNISGYKTKFEGKRIRCM